MCVCVASHTLQASESANAHDHQHEGDAYTYRECRREEKTPHINGKDTETNISNQTRTFANTKYVRNSLAKSRPISMLQAEMPM